MKSLHRTTVLAVSVVTGFVCPFAHANPMDFAATDPARQDEARPKLRLSTSLSRLPIMPRTSQHDRDGDSTPLKLAMATYIAGTSSTGASGSTGQPASGIQTESQALLEKYHKGAYSEVAKEGGALLEKEPNDDTLRFAVANSLAWSGFTSEAARQYEALAGTHYHDQALIGLGHVNRWIGRPDRAAHAYRQVLQRKPDNTEANSGLLLASRELRPVTAAKLGRAGNSDDSERTLTTLSHAWRNENGARHQKITVGRLEESNPRTDLVQRDISWDYDDPDALLTKAELSVQESPSTRVFGTISLKPADTPLQLHLGRLNWGKLAFNPQALESGLTANRVGADFSRRCGFGNVRFAYSAYRISDGNLVQNASAHLTPAMQPFGSFPVRAFFGLEARKSRFNDPRYWSPEEGQYSGLVGVNADWSNQWWQTSGSVQYGAPLTGESGHSWSAGFGVKHWLSQDWAASTEVWAIHSPRDGGYKAHSGSIRIERLW